MIQRLPEDAQTLHAEALALLLAQERDRGWSHLSGSFSSKVVKGSEYLYFQYSDPGGTKRQFAIGRRDRALEDIVAAYAAGRESQDRERARIGRLAGLLRSAGVATMPHGPARVIRALADAGVFAVGGVLMGSYAFLAIGNQLGLQWPGASWRTQDVDIAGHFEVAIPTSDADIPGALESLRMGFVPIPGFDPRSPSTSFRVRGEQLRVDLITPGGEKDEQPVPIPRFRAAAAPIKYLSLAMREAQPALVIEASNTTLVTVPSPARYALHKLLVSQTRSVVQQTKSIKDLHQSALLLEALAVDRPEELEDAARAFAESGPAVIKKVHRGFRAAKKQWPEIASAATWMAPLLAP